MLKKAIFSSLFVSTVLFANNCSDYYNPKKFYQAPYYLEELIEKNLHSKKLFDSKENMKSFAFKKLDDLYINEYIKQVEYIYPKKSGLFTYKLKDNKIDELTIATVNVYKLKQNEIAEELNNDFEGFWSDWIEDAYEMQLIPEQTLFKYKDNYFSFSVFIYGTKKDATKLSGTTIKYWFKDYTKEVKEFITCSSK